MNVLLSQNLKLQETVEIDKILKKAEENGILNVTFRQFGKKKSLTFYSLKLSVFSLESLSWVNKSLIKDEMHPNERAI